jgi:biotin carboxyl carrier protein
MTALEDARDLARLIANVGGQVTDSSPEFVDTPNMTRRITGSEVEPGEEAVTAPRPVGAPPRPRVTAQPSTLTAAITPDVTPSRRPRRPRPVATPTPPPAATITNAYGVFTGATAGSSGSAGTVRVSPFDSSADEIRARLVNNATGLRINQGDVVDSGDPVARRIAQHRANAARR